MSRQRSEQNGRNGFAGVHLTRARHVGQLIILDGSDIALAGLCAECRSACVKTVSLDR